MSVSGTIEIEVNGSNKSVVSKMNSSYPLRFIPQETWNTFAPIRLLGLARSFLVGGGSDISVKIKQNSNAW